MASRQVDALDCFSSLKDDVPSWITRVTDLASHTEAKHAEFSAEYARLSTTEKGTSRRRKNSSLHTNRGGAEEEEEGEEAKSVSTKQTDPESAALDPLTLMRLSRPHPQDRNRQPVDGPAASRSRNTSPVSRRSRQVIVHYDGHTQNTLELLVRDIGGARNNIRKGRMNSMMKRGFGMKSSFPSKGVEEGTKPMFRSTRAGPLKQGQQESPFDHADKQLELAQSFCESAAHQFLRIGDCSSELEKTKVRFTSVLDMASTEVERLQFEKEKEKKEEKEKPESTEDVKPTKPKAPEETLLKMEKGPPDAMATIEVDDASDASSISIDLTAFRRTRYRV